MKYTYDSIYQLVKAAGLLDPNAGTTTYTFTANFSIPLESYQNAVLALDFKEFQDQQFISPITPQPNGTSQVSQEMGIDTSGVNSRIPNAGEADILMNADRVVINSKDDFSFLFGQKGVALGSPRRVNIDSGQSITLFAHNQLFLGIPNKGGTKPTKPQTQLGTTKGDPTEDQLYDPMVLGIKLANLLEDILFTLKGADLVSGVSPVRFQPATQAEFGLLANRIPEILSSYAYLDGLSHAEINKENLAKLKEAQKKVKDYVPPKQLTGAIGTGLPLPPGGLNYTQPISGPYKDLPGYYDTPDGDLYVS